MAKKKKSHYHADMLSVEEAREKILREFNSLDEVRISLNESLGCVISKDIISNISYRWIYNCNICCNIYIQCFIFHEK